MASYQQVAYCKKCKTNVSLSEQNHCSKCGSTQINKTWSCRFRYVNENLMEVQKRLSGFETKKKCQEAYEKFIATAKHYKKLDKEAHNITFKELYHEYLEYAKTRLKQSSITLLEYSAEKHILPKFGDVKVRDITPKLILEWQNSLQKYSHNYKNKLRNTLSPMLVYADRYYGIPNQLPKVESFRNVGQKKEMQVWTPEEFSMFIEKESNPTYKTFFTVLYFSGARRGEIQALNWQDIDFKNNLIKITKTLNHKVKEIKWVITAPKNKSSIRDISMPKHVMKMLLDYKNSIPNEAFVFGGKEPLSDSSILRHKDAACKSAKVKIIRIHDFRHSHASFLLSNSISIVAVSKRLGHSNTTQTLDTYAHLMPKEADQVINVLEDF